LTSAIASRRETEKLEALQTELDALEQAQMADTLLLPRAQADEAELRRADDDAQQAWAKAHIAWVHGSDGELLMDRFNRIIPTGSDGDERYRAAERLKAEWQRVSADHQEASVIMHAVDHRLSARRPKLAYVASLIERLPGAQPAAVTPARAVATAANAGLCAIKASLGL
jgi:hypothetical protein